MKYPTELYLKIDKEKIKIKGEENLKKFLKDKIVSINRVLWDPRSGIDYKVIEIHNYGDKLSFQLVRVDSIK